MKKKHDRDRYDHGFGSCDVADTIKAACYSRSLPPFGGFQRFPVADIPVVLAEVILEADVEADIDLPSAAREIKSIRKNVYLKQAKAVPSVAFGIVKLFITGVVHKNIQYVEECSGYVKDYSVEVEFQCNQQVPLYNFAQNQSSQKNSVAEYRYLDKKGHGADHSKFGSFHYEFFNEPIEVKLVGAYINELDLAKDYDKHGHFHSITEKMEVVLFLKLLQVQQVNLRRRFFEKDAAEEGDMAELQEQAMLQAPEEDDLEAPDQSLHDRMKAIIKRLED
ncbi:hypothetical protein GJU40_16840 [Bacillus lacus]|uniref:DUF3794 domain-containing protein n=1 Tax=Metabacillus lacus TaxID=1983721 RepID=A0A7X2J1W3_9BACI|nr:hypothetical protein [Metabacillus lacus]MRX73811.1 hypothetical protein [Metabacillus lacus]